ncbi:MAG: alpha/beta fold hydrolase [Myxococcota bacterium]
MRPDFQPDPELFPFTSRWFDSAVGPVHYVDEGDGPPLLLLHGNPTWSFLYRHIIRELSSSFRCIAPDYPGFGLSERPAGYRYTPLEHADVVGDLVEHLDLREYLIMGQDWGGPIGIATALRDPERVRGLVFGNTWFWPTDRFLNKVFGRVMSGPMRRRVLEDNYFLEKLLPAGTARTLSEREMDAYRQAQPPGMREGVAELPRQLVTAGPWLQGLAERVPAALGGKPLALVWGMGDFAFPARHFVPRWQRTFADHQLVPLKGAKHFIQEDAPDRIAAAIRARYG